MCSPAVTGCHFGRSSPEVRIGVRHTPVTYEGMVELDRHDIDQIIGDEPFFMVSGGGHGGWANTAALKVAGIVKGEPDPIDHFGREPDGTPNGYVGTAAAVFYLLGKLESITPEGVASNLGAMLAASSANGVTTSFQAGHVQGMEDVFFEAIAALERSGRLPVRLSCAASFAQRPIHIDSSLANIKKYMPRYSSELFRVDALKIHGDGDFGGRTIGILEPYEDLPEAGLGMVSFPDQDQLERFVLDAAEAGVQHIHMHAIGDRTARQALDAFERVRSAGYEDIRLSTGHTYMVHPDDVPRFAELHVSADLHAQLAFGAKELEASWTTAVGRPGRGSIPFRDEVTWRIGDFYDDLQFLSLQRGVLAPPRRCGGRTPDEREDPAGKGPVLS